MVFFKNNFIKFIVSTCNNNDTSRHLDQRIECYLCVGGPIEGIRLQQLFELSFSIRNENKNKTKKAEQKEEGEAGTMTT